MKQRYGVLIGLGIVFLVFGIVRDTKETAVILMAITGILLAVLLLSTFICLVLASLKEESKEDGVCKR
jgi:hypothetical protein|tara:strand:+ start:486 stop:689 length:204 start_codon:yes stop_codon:yes gene_type:complete